MRIGDTALFFHSSTSPPAIAGLMDIVREAYPDPTAQKPGWVQVDVRYQKTFPKPLALTEIKKNPALQNMVLVKNTRLSVQPITDAEWDTILKIVDN